MGSAKIEVCPFSKKVFQISPSGLFSPAEQSVERMFHYECSNGGTGSVLGIKFNETKQSGILVSVWSPCAASDSTCICFLYESTGIVAFSLNERPVPENGTSLWHAHAS